ncbi:hypothetical protein JTB14_001310 [Gonioctena quinquepunctata]|nr:hypothetical protein JTB14_001310 [Gonioctena quinquepunctata]
MIQSYQHFIPEILTSTFLRNNGSNCGSKYGRRKKHEGWWSGVPMCPSEGIFEMSELFKNDKASHKINLSVGAYRDDDGKPYVLPSVRKAEEQIRAKYVDKEYLPSSGLPQFCSASFDHAFGKSHELATNRMNATVQTVSGSGALSLMAFFLKKFFPYLKTIYVPKPIWGQYDLIFPNAGLQIQFYRYYNTKTLNFDYKGILEDICRAPEHSMILFHACAHDPTGMDPSKEQWEELAELMKQRNNFPIFDMAYQGLVTGDPENDAFAVRHFAERGMRFALTQSYSKSMGLYGERIGALTILGDSEEEQQTIMSQLNALIRSTYAVPPGNGAKVVAEILSDDQLKSLWLKELKNMVCRVIAVRRELRDNLVKEGSKLNWDHIVKQVGMFCYTGLKPEQVEKLARNHSIYMSRNGRMSLVGVNTKNVEYIARAMHQTTKD